MFNQKGLGSITITTIVALIILGGGIFYISQNQTPASTTENDDVMMENDNAMTDDKEMEESAMSDDKIESDSMMEKDGNAMEDKNETMSKAGSYEDYDASKIAMAATNGKAVLFFHAGWCPTCRGLNSDIEKNLSKIPNGVTIFKTDYDTQTALKKKYGITYQHTMVQVDAQGNQITKWSGSPTLADLVSKIK
jgi:thiol-disulfide isomerase/thioredoxin